MQNGIHKTSPLLAHAENIGIDAFKVLAYLVDHTDPATGIATISTRELIQLNTSCIPSVTFRALKRLKEAGYIKEANGPVTVGQHLTYQTRLKNRLYVHELRVTLDCNELCSGPDHCPNPTYRAVLEHTGITPADLTLLLSHLSEAQSKHYRKMLFQQSPTATSKGFVPAFYTGAELAGEYAFLRELEAKRYVKISPHTDPDTYGVLPTPNDLPLTGRPVRSPQ